MKLLKLSYCDRYSGWSIDSCQFFPDLNLLVGISGAGKTSILGAINALKYITQGQSSSAIKWDVEFLTLNKVLYRWAGEFDRKTKNVDIDRSDSNANKPKIIYETIIKTQNGHPEKIVDRNLERTLFKGKETPKLSPFSSTIELLNQEEEFFHIKESFENIIFKGVELRGSNIINTPFMIHLLVLRNNIDYKKLISDDPCTPLLDIATKLCLVYYCNRKVFDSIKEKFLNIFLLIEDLKIEEREDISRMIFTRNHENIFDIFSSDSTNYLVQIKEKRSEEWIYMTSSGMIKTLIYLATIELSPPGSVILIDEFENSLGVNCLDSLTENFLLGSRDLQFIITSHHPYIINNISPDHWKIITRKGGIITARNAEDYHISKSRQKAFIDLINVLDEFPEGLDEG